jgi:histidinol-phosphate/aromatic aminotransferase/cobyric acid decarboxylase-like protein
MTTSLQPGPHGGDVEHIARALGVDVDSLLDLSASMNPVAPDIAALASARLSSLRRYPDASVVRRLMAEALGVEADRVLLTNGGSEAIALLGQELGGRVDEPEFSLHPRGARDAPLWRSNPHNPTGRLVEETARAEVWDEAFYPLATGQWTRGDTAAMATVGSLTKVFACPGLRMGYVIADPEIIKRLEARQPQWSLGSLAIAVLPDLLGAADLVRWTSEIAQLRTELTALLVEFGLLPRPSDANYLLCAAPAQIRTRLLAQGVVVRDCTSFGLPDMVRIAVPDASGLERLAGALKAVGPTTLSSVHQGAHAS